MIADEFMIEAQGGLQGEIPMQCSPENVALIYQKTHQSSKKDVIVIQTQEGTKLRSDMEFDALYALLQRSGQVFMDALSTDGQNDINYLVNLKYTDPAGLAQDSMVALSVKGLPNEQFYLLDDRDQPLSLEDYYAMINRYNTTPEEPAPSDQ